MTHKQHIKKQSFRIKEAIEESKYFLNKAIMYYNATQG